ncbi:MAG: RNA-binding protein [Bdellovibrionales bacterium]|nr:RNA-binding protein [Bdellovibrionales bacterium]
MSKRIYIGNLAFSATESSVNQLFSEYGKVNSCQLITDRSTGQSKGFGFVEMDSAEDATKAISELNGHDVNGRNIKVNEANAQTSRSNGDTVIHKRAGFSGGKSRYERAQRPIRGY